MIRIYYMKIEGDCSHEQSLALYGMLTKERQRLVDQAKSEEIAKKRLYTGAFLQFVLSKETGIPVEQLQYRSNEWGKPALDVENMLRVVSSDVGDVIKNLHFNLSHSGDYMVLALSDSPVGIDVEHKSKNYDSLAQRCFCKEEYEDILSLQDESERKCRFLEYWTMKEAYIKCIGEGMRIPLNSFLIKRGLKGISGIQGKDGCFRTFVIDTGYYVSVCGLFAEGFEENVNLVMPTNKVCIRTILEGKNWL